MRPVPDSPISSAGPAAWKCRQNSRRRAARAARARCSQPTPSRDGPLGAGGRSYANEPGTLWRYLELLPVRDSRWITTLGEGFTPVLDLGTVPEADGLEVWLKDDGTMPTGSFKARGMAVAVSRARELGIPASTSRRPATRA